MRGRPRRSSGLSSEVALPELIVSEWTSVGPIDTDVIAIDHSVVADFQALLAAAHDDGHGNAVIAPDANHSITVNNVTVAQLVQHQGDFHFT